MKHALSILAILAAFGAHATGKPPSHPPQPQGLTQNVGITSIAASLGVGIGRGGAGGAGGAGGTAYSSGGAAQVLGSGNGTAYGGSLSLNGARLGGDVNVQPSAPAIYGMASNPAPTTCDGAGVSIGGSGRSGGGLLNFGVGERESCLAAQDAATMRAAKFTDEDVQRRVCQVSTIAKTPTCKRYAEADARSDRAAALPEDRHTRAYMAAKDPGLLP